MTKWETFGACLAVGASIISNLGVNVQKFSHAKEAELPNHTQRPYIKRPLWWLGLLLVIAGSIGDFVAFGCATQSLVAALGGGSTLVANVVMAYLLNGEAIFTTDLGGVFFVATGVVVIAYTAEPNVDYPLPELEKSYCYVEFVIYIVTVCVCMVTILATIQGSAANNLKAKMNGSKSKMEKLKKIEVRISSLEHRMKKIEQKYSILNGEQNAMVSTDQESSRRSESMKNSNSTDDLDSSSRNSLEPIYYAICSGITGAITVLLAKCSAVMISLSLKGDNQFRYALTYVFLGGMVICIFIQTHFLNMATSTGDIMTVFPVFQACWITFSVVGGAVFYESAKSFTTEKWALYPLALISIGGGVGMLTQHGKGKIVIAGTSLSHDDIQKTKVCNVKDASIVSPLLSAGEQAEYDEYLQLPSGP